MFDFTGGNTAEDIQLFFTSLEKIRQRMDIKFTRITRWLTPDRKQALTESVHQLNSSPRVPGTMLPMISLPHDPADRVDWTEAGRKRYFMYKTEAGTESAPYIRSINRAAGICKRSETMEKKYSPQKHNTPVDRSLIADMPGTVILKEHDFEVEFYNGRFINIISEKGPLLAGLQTQSYISTPEGRYPFENTGVYSFESEHIRGLREILSLDTPFSVKEGKLVIDYMFIGEFPSLFVSVDVLYPEFTRQSAIHRYAPLEIGLFYFNSEDSLTVEGVYPDGTRYTMKIPYGEGIYNLPGRGHIFKKNDIAFTMLLPPIEEYPVDLVPAKVEITKKGGLLSINPRGSYVPTQAQFVSAFAEHFTIMISAAHGQRKQEKIPLFVLEQLQQSWLGKEEI